MLKLLPYPAANHPSGTIHFKGKELLNAPERDMRAVRGNDITIIFQEPMTSLNPLHTIEKQIGEILELHHGVKRRQSAATASSNCSSRSAFRIRPDGCRAIRISSPAGSASA